MVSGVKLSLSRSKPTDALHTNSDQDAKIRAMLAHYMAGDRLEAIPADYLGRSVPSLDGLTPRAYVASHGLDGLEDVLNASFTVGHGMPE